MPARKPVQKISGRRSGVDRRVKQVEPTLIGVHSDTGERSIKLYLRSIGRGSQRELKLMPDFRSGVERRGTIADRRTGPKDRRLYVERRTLKPISKMDEIARKLFGSERRNKTRRKSSGRRATDKK